MTLGGARQSANYGNPFGGGGGTGYMDKPRDSSKGGDHKEWARSRARAQKDLKAHVNWLNDLRREVTNYEPSADEGGGGGKAATNKAGTGEWLV